jgi:hypothetical protein
MGTEVICFSSNAVIPAKAGISCGMRTLYFHETPAFAGVTELVW